MNSIRKNIAKSISEVDLPEIYSLNRKINAGPTEKFEIPVCMTHIDRTVAASYTISAPNIPFGIYFYQGVSDQRNAYITFENIKAVPFFFDFTPPKTESFEFSKFVVFFQQIELLNIDEVVESSDVKIPKLKALVYNVDLPLTEVKIAAAKFKLKSEVSHDLIEEFLPEIITPQLLPKVSDIEVEDHIDILNNLQVKISGDKLLDKECSTASIVSDNTLAEEEFVSTATISSNILSEKYFVSIAATSENFFTEDKTITATDISDNAFVDKLLYPKILQLKIQEWKESKQSVLTNIEIKEIPIVSDSNLISDPATNLEHKQLAKFLEPVYELTPEMKENILKVLPDYQKAGAEFLYKNDFALFNDAFEIGKESQAIVALRMLLRVRKIKKILILTNNYNNNICKHTPLISHCGLWQEKLNILLNEYQFKFHDNLDESTKKEIFRQHIINGISYETFEEGFINGMFNHDDLNLFDCIIFDDTSHNILTLNCVSLLEANAYENKLWFLSDIVSDELKEKIEEIFPERKLEVFGRNIKEIEELKHQTIAYDYFLPMDEDNQELELQINTEGREKIDNLFGVGNYFRIQPNAFQLIQESQRTTNFVFDKLESAKTSLLIHHLNHILSQNDRVLIYSQFDKGGIQEVETIVKSLNYSYIKFGYSDSYEEIQNKIKHCEKSEDKIIYLVNMKPNKINFIFPKVHHLINFDNWWNPLTRWKLEKQMDTSNEHPVVVYNYYYNNSIETKLMLDLTSKGLLDRNVIFPLTPDKLNNMFDESYWANFFNIEYNIVKKQVDFTEEVDSVMQLIELVRLLLNKLGYDLIKARAFSEDETYELMAESSAGHYYLNVKTICSKHINSQFINDLLESKPVDQPMLIITNGTISHSKVILPPDVSLINGTLLSSYLEFL